MRIRILALFSLLVLAFFAIDAYSQNNGLSADDYINKSRGQGGVESVRGEYASPQASRLAQTGQKNKDILGVTLGGKLTSGAANPQEARGQTPPTTTTTAEVMSVDGSWSFELANGNTMTADITLFQSGGAVFGSGSMSIDENTTRQLAASGSVTGDRLDLDLVTMGAVNLYRIALTVSGDSASGSYNAFSPIAAPSTGSAKGQRSVGAS